MLRKTIPLYAAALGWVAVGIFCWLVMSAGHERPGSRPVQSSSAPNCDYVIKRVKGYSRVGPLLSAEPTCESNRMSGMKNRVASFFEAALIEGTITRASVYVRDFRRAEWFSLNGTEQYDPGSLMKIPIVMTALKMGELDPGFLNKNFTLYTLPQLPNPNFPPVESIQIGNTYSVKDLIRRDIEFSDNRANSLLIEQLNHTVFKDLLVNIGLRKVEGDMKRYPMSAPEYATFLKALYNASFLSPENSELLMDLMVSSDFNSGLRRGVPANVEVAHKFGESGSAELPEFHEAAIVYPSCGPYILVVMTQGPKAVTLPAFVAGVSNIVYEGMVGSPMCL